MKGCPTTVSSTLPPPSPVGRYVANDRPCRPRRIVPRVHPKRDALDYHRETKGEAVDPGVPRPGVVVPLPLAFAGADLGAGRGSVQAQGVLQGRDAQACWRCAVLDGHLKEAWVCIVIE